LIFKVFIQAFRMGFASIFFGFFFNRQLPTAGFARRRAAQIEMAEVRWIDTAGRFLAVSRIAAKRLPACGKFSGGLAVRVDCMGV